MDGENITEEVSIHLCNDVCVRGSGEIPNLELKLLGQSCE